MLSAAVEFAGGGVESFPYFTTVPKRTTMTAWKKRRVRENLKSFLGSMAVCWCKLHCSLRIGRAGGGGGVCVMNAAEGVAFILAGLGQCTAVT